MAVIGSTGSKITWSEISSLYTKLNTARSKFGFSNITVPSSQVGALATTSHLKTINDTIVAMRNSNGNVGGLTFTAPTIPSAGSLIQPLPWSTVESNIDFMQNNCASNFGFSFTFNSAFFASNFGFSFTFNSAFFASNFSFTFSGNFNFSFTGNFTFAFSFTGTGYQAFNNGFGFFQTFNFNGCQFRFA